MLDADKINFYLEVFKGLTPEDIIGLFQLATPRHLPASEVLIKEGATNHNLVYIQKGVIRSYMIKDSGDEVTVLLRWEDQFIASYDTIILQQPSRFTYQALEDCEILEIDYAAVEKIMEEQPKYEPLRTFFLMSMLAESLLRVESFVLFSPEERYQKLVESNANIVNRVPDKYIASLLGITPVSLSRIRKRIASRQKQ